MNKSNFKNLIKFFAISIIVVAGLFVFSQSAKAATYTFTQSSWTGGATSITAVHPTNQTGWTYASTTDSNIATSTAGQLTLKATAASATQTDDGTTASGFNLAGSAMSSTAVVGTGAGASIKLATLLDIGSGADGSFNPSLGDVVGGCATVKGMTWNSPTCTINTSNATYLGTYNFTTVNIPSGTTLTTSGTTNGLVIKATGDVTVAGSINLAGKGCAGGIADNTDDSVNNATSGGGGGSACSAGGTGAGIFPPFNNRGGGGGGHGGIGGQGSIVGNNGGLGGGTYDSASQPVLLGSGGGGGGKYMSGTTYNPDGGPGGGAIKIVTSGTVTINGSITANGSNGVDYIANAAMTSGGGGSGGSIWIQAGTLAGNAANITANGGRGGNLGICGSTDIPGGGGAGGLIALYYGTSIYSNTPSSAGGAGGSGCANSGAAGGTATPYSSAIAVYPLSGTYTSGAINTGQKSDFTTVSWNASTNASTTANIAIKTCDNSDCSDVSSFTSIATTTNGTNDSSSYDMGSAFDGKQYIQYRLTLSTTDIAYTPSLNDITINYQYYPSEIQSGTATVDYNSTTNYLCDGAGCPSANATITGGAAKLVKQRSPVAEITPTANTKGLWHFNSTSGAEANNEGVELAATTTNAVGLWHMNGTLNASADAQTIADSQTNVAANNGTGNDGATNGTLTYKAGKFSNALSFDGVDDYVSVANESNFDFATPSPFSIGAWVETTSTIYSMIVAKGTNADPYSGYVMYLDSTGQLGGYLIGTPTTNRINELTTNGIINDGSWHYVTMTYDGSSLASGLKLYVDGIEKTTSVFFDALTSSILTDVNLRIGTRDGGGAPFNGSIDEVAVYNTALTQTQITDHYRRGVAEDATVSDSAFEANDGNIYGPITTAGQTGLNQALSFDGVDDYVYATGTALDVTTNFTAEAWVKTSTTSTVAVIANRNWLTANNSTGGWNVTLNNGAAGNLSFVYGDTTTYGVANFTPPVPLNNNNWRHIAVVVSGTTFTLFADGAQVGSSQTMSPATIVFNPNHKFTIGANLINGAAAGFFPGSIDEVAVWNTALDAPTIEAHALGALNYTPSSGATVTSPNDTSINPTIVAYTSFYANETLPNASTTIGYQLSYDDGATWCNYSGGWSCSSGNATYSTELQINSGIGSFTTSTFQIKVRAQLNTEDTANTPELDNIRIGFSGSTTGDYYSTINRGASANNLGKLIWNSEPESVAPVSGTPTTTLTVKLAVSNISNPGSWSYQDLTECVQTGKKVECISA